MSGPISCLSSKQEVVSKHTAISHHIRWYFIISGMSEIPFLKVDVSSDRMRLCNTAVDFICLGKILAIIGNHIMMSVSWKQTLCTINLYRCLMVILCIARLGTFSMMTSSNGNIFRVTGPFCGEFTGPGEFPAQRPVTRSFDVFFDLRLNKRLSKQPWGWWFETTSWSLWRHCNGECCRYYIITVYIFWLM